MASYQPSSQPNTMMSTESKGSDIPTFSGMPPTPVPSTDVCMETSPLCPPDSDMSGDCAAQAEDARQPASNRKLANNAPGARLLIRQLHTRVPAWKLPLCVQALNARPIDVDHIAEVTDIRFANEELVLIAAKCSADLSGESDLTETVGQPTEHTGATLLASDLAERVFEC